MPEAEAVTATGAPACLVGFDGKLPSRGDFVSEGLPRSFLRPWRDWVEQAVAASRAALGEDDWQAAWVVAPIWHFTCPGGMVGPDAFTGLMLPSVDKAGRYFPLAVVALYPGRAAAPGETATASWRLGAEAAALDALAHDHDPATLIDALARLEPPHATVAGTEALWWTEGGPQVPAGRLVLSELPAPVDFARMIREDGVT